MASGYAIAGTMAYEVISGMQQAELIRGNAQLTKELNDFNADLAMLDSYHAEQDGYSKSARYDNVVKETLSDQKAMFASKGIDSGFGTAEAVQGDTKLKGFLNQQDIMNEAHSRAMGIQNEANNMRLQGYLGQTASSLHASATENAAVMGAAKTGLSLSGYGKAGKASGYETDSEKG